MDVTRLSRIALILFGTTVIAACAKDKDPNDLFLRPAGSCESQAMSSQFVVTWNDGRTTRHNAPNKDKFLSTFVKEHVQNIEMVEHDFLVHSRARGFEIEDYDQTPENDVTWGPRRIEADEAWNLDVKGQGVIVAVIDSPVDIYNDQLTPRLALNVGEFKAATDEDGDGYISEYEAQNGKDDDGNGFIDDLFGYNFGNDSADMSYYPRNPHGTQVAGIILADHTTGPIKGVAPEAQLLPVPFMREDGKGAISDAIDAINYAVARGARVINASWGGDNCSQALQRTLQGLQSKNVLFVTAAGNDGENLEQHPEYPAAFQMPHMLTVGASGYHDFTFVASNYSSRLVHIMAPGVNVWSTEFNNDVRPDAGTSFAAPFVAGTAALLMSHRPNATAQEVRDAILNSADPGDYQVVSKGRLNAHRALSELEKIVGP